MNVKISWKPFVMTFFFYKLCVHNVLKIGPGHDSIHLPYRHFFFNTALVDNSNYVIKSFIKPIYKNVSIQLTNKIRLDKLLKTLHVSDIVKEIIKYVGQSIYFVNIVQLKIILKLVCIKRQIYTKIVADWFIQ